MPRPQTHTHGPPDPAARVRALEQRFPDVEKGLRRQLSSGDNLPSRSIGTGTLLSRVVALERAMDTLLVAQVGDECMLGLCRCQTGSRGCCAGLLCWTCDARAGRPAFHRSRTTGSLPLHAPFQETVLEETRRSGAVQPENPGACGCCTVM